MPEGAAPQSLNALKNDLREAKKRKRKLRPCGTAEIMDKLAFELDNLPGGALAPPEPHHKSAVVNRIRT